MTTNNTMSESEQLKSQIEALQSQIRLLTNAIRFTFVSSVVPIYTRLLVTGVAYSEKTSSEPRKNASKSRSLAPSHYISN
jgi:hypothetical protein